MENNMEDLDLIGAYKVLSTLDENGDSDIITSNNGANYKTVRREIVFAENFYTNKGVKVSSISPEHAPFRVIKNYIMNIDDIRNSVLNYGCKFRVQLGTNNIIFIDGQNSKNRLALESFLDLIDRKINSGEHVCITSYDVWDEN